MLTLVYAVLPGLKVYWWGSGVQIGKGLCGFTLSTIIVGGSFLANACTADSCVYSWFLCTVQVAASVPSPAHAARFYNEDWICFSWCSGFCIIIFQHVPIQPFFYLQTIFPEPQPRKSDVFHLAANLMDRYLGYYPPSTEGEFRTVASACTMISVKLRRSREETLSYESLRPHFYDISEKEVKVSYYNNSVCLKLTSSLNSWGS